MDWEAWLRDLLCRMIKEMGGSCATLGVDPPAWIATVDTAYMGQVPTFPTKEAKNGFLFLLSELECSLDDARSSLSSSDEGKARSLIARLRNAIPPP